VGAVLPPADRIFLGPSSLANRQIHPLYFLALFFIGASKASQLSEMDTSHYHLNLCFFLEHAGELRIFILRRKGGKRTLRTARLQEMTHPEKG
jgi:hypothetical protein